MIVAPAIKPPIKPLIRPIYNDDLIFSMIFTPGRIPYGLTSNITGIRYDFLNASDALSGNATAFGNNVPRITEDGLKACSAYTVFDNIPQATTIPLVSDDFETSASLSDWVDVRGIASKSIELGGESGGCMQVVTNNTDIDPVIQKDFSGLTVGQLYVGILKAKNLTSGLSMSLRAYDGGTYNAIGTSPYIATGGSKFSPVAVSFTPTVNSVRLTFRPGTTGSAVASTCNIDNLQIIPAVQKTLILSSAGTYTLYVQNGSGPITISGASTGNGTAILGAPITFTTASAGQTITIIQAGEVVRYQINSGPIPFPWVPTSVSLPFVSVDESGANKESISTTSYPKIPIILNGTNFRIDVWAKMNGTSTYISVFAAANIFLTSTNGAKIGDGTTQSAAGYYTAGNDVKLSLVCIGSSMKLYVDGVAGSTYSYDGSLNIGAAFQLFYPVSSFTGICSIKKITITKLRSWPVS